MAKILVVLVSNGPPAAEASVEAWSVHLNFLEVDDFFRDFPLFFPAKAIPAAPAPCSMLELPLALDHKQLGVNGNTALKVISPLLKNPQPKQCNSIGK